MSKYKIVAEGETYQDWGQTYANYVDAVLAKDTLALFTGKQYLIIDLHNDSRYDNVANANGTTTGLKHKMLQTVTTN